MPFDVSLQQAQKDYPKYTFVKKLTPSEQKAAFHVTDSNGNDLCLKIIAPNYCRDRLDREILALQSISHKNVAKLVGYSFSSFQMSQQHFLLEEYIEGCDLSDILLPGEQWSYVETIDFFIELCDGLSALHDKKIVHRDLKPKNIRVRPDRTPVIIDLGLARLLDMPALTRTIDGAAIGTPLYFAPEQFYGTKYDIDHRTDLFALGILIYQSLVGDHPFCCNGMDMEQLEHAVCNSTDHVSAPKFIALSDVWKLVIRRLLEKERAKRPNNAVQVATILRNIG